MNDWLKHPDAAALHIPTESDYVADGASPEAAGRELDTLVAEKVMGFVWRRSRNTGRRCIYHPERIPEWMDQPATGSEPLVGDWAACWWTPAFSTDISAAWCVVQRMQELDFRVTMAQDFRGVPDKWHVSLDGPNGSGYAEGLPLPESICRAALAALTPRAAHA